MSSAKRQNPRSTRKPEPPTEASPIDSAKSAGLRYVTDAKPGITRKRSGKSFRYFTSDSSRALSDPEILGRIKSLVIPPAWNEVWICPIANGHLQATGRDAKGRKQSRYHPRWREVRDEAKFEHITQFADALPAIRKQVDHDLALPGLPIAKVLATIVRLMETTFIRVGNEEYARTNKSYGLTTMRNRHIDITGATVQFSFDGKSGKHHSINLTDRRVANILKRCKDLPGYELFQYLDAEGNRHSIDSSDVNDYLRQITPSEVAAHFTAKDFRTWAGTVLACTTLTGLEPFTSETQAKRNLVEAIKTVAEQLGNTPAVCRKCYIHPAIMNGYLAGQLVECVDVPKRAKRQQTIDSIAALRAEEQALMRFLSSQLLGS
jgi:DNA topoisomerase-1